MPTFSDAIITLQIKAYISLGTVLRRKMLHCGCKICCKYGFMLISCWPHDDSFEGPQISLSNCCLFSLCFLMFSSIMLISVLPLFCLSFLISLCSLLSSSTLLLFPFFAVIFSTFIPHPHCRMLSFLSINLFQYSTSWVLLYQNLFIEAQKLILFSSISKNVNFWLL